MQKERHLRADPEDLPQGDDPRFESRVAFTGRGGGNQKVIWNLMILRLFLKVNNVPNYRGNKGLKKANKDRVRHQLRVRWSKQRLRPQLQRHHRAL